MKAFLSSISRNKRFVVAELFLVYFAHGLGSIMLGSVLPDLRAAYGLDYQLGGTLISSQSVGYLGIGLLSGILAVKWGLKRAYLILYYLFAVGFVMLLTGGSPLWLLAAMFLTGISKGGITDYNNRVMSEYANGSATPLNMLHAAFAFGACVAPLAVLACQKLGGENGWRLALEIAVVLLTFGFVFGLFMKMDEEKPADGAQEEVKSGSFRDVTSTHWAFDSVERAAEMGLVTGYSDGTFRPDTPVTRAQFVLMLWRMCGKPAAAKAASFADASASWYQDALSWAVEKGYVNGLSDTRFGPDAPITRQQAMAILFRLNGGQSGSEQMLTGVYEQTFTDSGTIASWAKDATWWAVYHELVSGTGGSRIAPEANASRAQIAAILLRYADKFMTMEEAA